MPYKLVNERIPEKPEIVVDFKFISTRAYAWQMAGVLSTEEYQELLSVPEEKLEGAVVKVGPVTIQPYP